MLCPKSCDTTDIPILFFVHTTCSRCKWQYRLPSVILNSVDFSVCAVAKLARYPEEVVDMMAPDRA